MALYKIRAPWYPRVLLQGRKQASFHSSLQLHDYARPAQHRMQRAVLLALLPICLHY